MSGRKQHIVVGLSGGLGNQLFQYAAGRALSVRLGLPLVLDTTWFCGRDDREYALAPLRINASLDAGSSLLPAGLVSLWRRAMRRWGSLRMGAPIFREAHFHYVSDFDDIHHAVYLEGYWQSHRYFDSIRASLLQEFTPSAELPAACRPILNAIHGSNAICVHVRRGDYVSNPVAAQTHGLCSMDYYQRALAAIPRNEYSQCFVFSDDPAWVREHMQLDCPMTVVDVNSPEQAHWDLYLMAACRHFVIANSSLSWWAAWLGSAENKVVVAPLNWFKSGNKDTRDLIPADWLRL